MSIDTGNFLKKFNMKNINKIINITLIFILIVGGLCSDIAYALRLPLIFNSTERKSSQRDSNKKEPFREPVYGDADYWFGNLKITHNDLINLGLIKRRYEYGEVKDFWYLDDVFNQFRNAPKEVRKRLIDRIQKPERNHARIMSEQKKILSIIEYMREHYDDQTLEKLKSLSSLIGIYSLQNSNIKSDSWPGGSTSSFGEAIRILRNKHYPKGKWYRSNDPRSRTLYEQRDDFPETTRALIHLAVMIIIQKEIYEMLPEDTTGIIKEWRDDIYRFLNRKEIQPFLEREQFLELVERVYSEGIPRNFVNNFDREEVKIPESMIELVKNREFLELVEMHKDIWKIDGSSGEAFLRHFPNGRINGILSEMDYYARICLMILEDDCKMPDIYQPVGTIKLDEYINPQVSGKKNKNEYSISAFSDIFNRMKKEGKTEITVQPISITLGDGRSAILLSGPNMGGKTTTVRGIGLAVLLTQMGFPIPANDPRLGLFKNIYTVFPQPEQLHAGYGYFGMLIKELTDLTRVKKAGTGDFIILDEVPTGTDYYELVAVTVVLLEDLIKSGATVIVTGHLKKAFEIVSASTGQEPLMHTVSIKEGEIKPDFKLVPGIAKKSYAIELMRQADLPQVVQDLARSYYGVITGAADSKSIPSELRLDVQQQDDASELAKEADVHSVEMVLKALYPDEHFAFKREMTKIGQEAIIDEIISLASGKLRPKTQKEIVEYHRLIKIFVSQGINRLQVITRDLLFLDDIAEENMRWDKPAPEEVMGEGKLKLEAIELFFKKLKQDLESLGRDEKIDEILLFFAKQIDIIPKLRKKYMEKDLSHLGEKEARELADSFTEKWNDMIIATKANLLFVDRFAGMAQSVIKFGLKAPVISDGQNVFSLKNSRPFFPTEQSRDPFIPDAVLQSFALNPDKPVMVITGPNSSGKTVLMFNSYMNAILALNGHYVSGDMEISRFNRILVFLGGQDDISNNESYFLNILRKYSKILKTMVPGDLAILDELHGTDYFELAAIQMAGLHYLRALKVSAIFNTHVRDGLKIVDDKVGLDIWQTDFNYDEKMTNIKPHYTVSPDPDLKAQSFGLVVAKEWLAESQFQRAKTIYEFLIADKDIPKIDLNHVVQTQKNIDTSI
jgi:DNA mismatch repair ATPase MutS